MWKNVLVRTIFLIFNFSRIYRMEGSLREQRGRARERINYELLENFLCFHNNMTKNPMTRELAALHLVSLVWHPLLLRAINISLNWTIKESNLCVFKTDTGNPVSETLNLMLLRCRALFFWGEMQRQSEWERESIVNRLEKKINLTLVFFLFFWWPCCNENLNICLIILIAMKIKRRHASLDKWVSSDICHRYVLLEFFHSREFMIFTQQQCAR